MSEYTRQILKVVVAKICQTIGWHSIQTSSLDIMVDILRRYFIELTKLTHAYAEQFGHTQPNLDELGLAFRDMHINIADLEEYVRYVKSAIPLDVPLYPVPKESHLNFLKPGSSEVVTRPVHIHEYLPPMIPDVEDAEPGSNQTENTEESQANNTNDDSKSDFKRPTDVPLQTPRRARLVVEEEGRPTREISSVMMTTSGFLSPAREGKLPEARNPINQHDNHTSHLNTQTNIGSESRFERKGPKIGKDMKKIDKKKDKASKELFKPINDNFGPKKITTMKDVVKLKAMKANAANQLQNSLNAGLQLFDSPAKLNPTKPPKLSKAQQKLSKMEKAASVLTPSPSPPIPKPVIPPVNKVIEGKLSSEPDKLKLNIFKKISKVKEDKIEKVEKTKIKDEPRTADINESRESSPDLIIDESYNMRNWDQSAKSSPMKPLDLVIKHEVQEKVQKTSHNDNITKMFETIKNTRPEKDFVYDDDMSPPGTPSTPKTPEMPSHSPPLIIETEKKRKRKEKGKTKNKSKQPKYSMSPRRNKSDSFEAELERPKTPEDPMSMAMSDDLSIPPPNVPPMFSFFPNFISGPGLIPTPIGNSLFPRMPLAAGLPKHGFGQPAHIPPAMPVLPFIPPVKQPAEEQMDQASSPTIPEQDITDKYDVPVPTPKEKHKKDKKDKIKKKNKKDKIKNKSEKRKLKEEKKEKDKEKLKKEKKEKKREKEREHEGSVPKLTLKIGSPRPPTPDVQIARKIMIKAVVKKDEESPSSSTSLDAPDKRESSPELARISALITRPPKPKPTTISYTSPFKLTRDPSPTTLHDESPTTMHAKLKDRMFHAVPKIKKRKNKRSLEPMSEVETTDKGITEPVKPLVVPSAYYFDPDGNKVWICPACGRQDDGSPMIGCDDCDAWYHWVCVGIQVPPDDNEDWYCRICIGKKQETLQMDKKKKRKKKDKKDH